MGELIRNEAILKEAEGLFPKDVLEELQEWYTYTLREEWRYVVFTARRSYVMALILEQMTGKKMESDYAEYLTDASFFLRCAELADLYREYGSFPRILLCDDLMIHGRNINHIIEEVQRELIRLLSDEFEENIVRYALTRAINIHVYVRSNRQLLLSDAYALKMHYMREEAPCFWHQLSNNLSSFIFRANITNASYIYTEYLSDVDMERIIERLLGEDGYIHTTYQRIDQYTKLVYFGAGTKIKGVLSLRIIKNEFCEGYRVAPFAFIPNMNAEETDSLLRIVLEKVPQPYREWLEECERLNGKRSFNEMITLLVSDVILKEFNRKYEIVQKDADKKREILKLARNYDLYGLNQTIEMLEAFAGEDFSSLLSYADIDKIFEIPLPEERLMLDLVPGEKTELSSEEKNKIKTWVEDYFYKCGYMDERAAYEQLQHPASVTGERKKRRVRGCCFTLKELNQKYDRMESMYCIAYFLQMIDAGVAGLSSYASISSRVVGYAQFAKAGEQSLLIEPLRMYRYLPMLSRMQLECRRRLRDLKEEIRTFETGWSLQLSTAGLAEFMDKLSEIGQTAEDWDGSYIRKLDGSTEELREVMKKQDELYRQYGEYVKGEKETNEQGDHNILRG